MQIIEAKNTDLKAAKKADKDSIFVIRMSDSDELTQTWKNGIWQPTRTILVGIYRSQAWNGGCGYGPQRKGILIEALINGNLADQSFLSGNLKFDPNKESRMGRQGSYYYAEPNEEEIESQIKKLSKIFIAKKITELEENFLNLSCCQLGNLYYWIPDDRLDEDELVFNSSIAETLKFTTRSKIYPAMFACPEDKKHEFDKLIAKYGNKMFELRKRGEKWNYSKVSDLPNT